MQLTRNDYRNSPTFRPEYGVGTWLFLAKTINRPISKTEQNRSNFVIDY